MKIEKLLVLFLLIFLIGSCNLPDDPFNRPKIAPTIMSNCTGFQDGEVVDATNYIGVSPDEYNELQKYYDDIEYRLYICKKYRKRCK